MEILTNKMAEDQYKRNVAFKFRIGDLLSGKPIFDSSTQRFSFLEFGDKKIVRVNIAGNIVDRFESTGETKYIFLTLDDGSGQIQLRVFGDDVVKFKEIQQGETVVVIGVLRNFNNNLYLTPEIIKQNDPKYLLVRKLELEKQRAKNAPKIENSQQIIAVKDKILEKIKSSEAEGGIDTDKIIMDLREASPEVINQEIRKLLEEGIIFEPRPGRLRWLG